MRDLVGIIGVGFVGGAILKSLKLKGLSPLTYDKFKDSDSVKDVSKCGMVFLCLPTPFIEDGGYDKTNIYEALDLLEENGFSG